MTPIIFSMASWTDNLSWRLHWDNPDWRGWTVVAAYAMGAIFCLRAARAARQSGQAKGGAPVFWWGLGFWLLLMAINKQLDLQSLMIDLARQAARAGGWFGHRRTAQAVFFGVLAMGGLTALLLGLVRFRGFFKHNPFIAAGLAVFLSVVIFRMATINHVSTWINDRCDDKKWTWALEVCSSGCFALAATRAGIGDGHLMTKKPDPQ